MTDARTIAGWLTNLGWTVRRDRKGVLGIEVAGGPGLPPLRAACVEHWVLLALGPVLEPTAPTTADLWLRLLTVNRDMRVAKYALDDDDSVVLCAELPTESLDEAELVDVVTRLVRYHHHYVGFLSGD